MERYVGKHQKEPGHQTRDTASPVDNVRSPVNTLIDAHRQGRDVDACIAILSTHLGHITPAHTYYYLTVTPALADAVSERAALYYQGGLFR